MSIVLLGLGYLAFVIVMAMRGQTVSGWASTIACVLVMGGIQLIVLGIMSEYLAQQTELLRGRPLYVVRSRTRSAWTGSASSG
jgi:dolichol-phosphate mannosyltransferase